MRLGPSGLHLLIRGLFMSDFACSAVFTTRTNITTTTTTTTTTVIIIIIINIRFDRVNTKTRSNTVI